MTKPVWTALYKYNRFECVITVDLADRLSMAHDHFSGQLEIVVKLRDMPAFGIGIFDLQCPQFIGEQFSAQNSWAPRIVQLFHVSSHES